MKKAIILLMLLLSLKINHISRYRVLNYGIKRKVIFAYVSCFFYFVSFLQKKRKSLPKKAFPLQ